MARLEVEPGPVVPVVLAVRARRSSPVAREVTARLEPHRLPKAEEVAAVQARAELLR